MGTNWIQRFLTAITTHKGDADAHHAQSHHARHEPGGADPMRWGTDKLLKGAGAGADPTEIDAPDPESVLDIFDDFISGTLVSGEVGSLGWGYTADAIGVDASSANHPGLLWICSAATTGNRTLLYLLTPNADLLRCQAPWELTFIVYSTPLTNTRVFIGAIDNLGNAPGDQSRAGFEFDTALGDTNWMMCTGNGAASTRTPSDIAISVDFRKLKIVNASGASYEFFIDGVSKGTLDTNLPNAVMAIGMSAEALNDELKELHIDFFRVKLAGITR